MKGNIGKNDDETEGGSVKYIWEKGKKRKNR